MAAKEVRFSDDARTRRFRERTEFFNLVVETRSG